MIISHTSYQAIKMAAIATGGVRFKRFDPVNAAWTRWNVTLTNSGARFQRRGATGRRIGALCAHGFYLFFKNLFTADRNAVVRSAFVPKLTKQNLEQKMNELGMKNIGSMMRPFYWRDACDCEK